MRTLLIGFGNADRGDDGVALVVINGLRRLLGQPPLEDGEDGFAGLGRSVDSLFLHELMPELAETIAQYERVLFIDAHVGTVPELIRWAPVTPALERAIVSHHVLPGGLLALCRQIYGKTPQAELVSIRGSDFDFGAGLSPETAAGAEQTITDIYRSLTNTAI